MTSGPESPRAAVTDQELIRAGADLADRFGAERATAFGRSLPRLVAELTERWGLQTEALYPSGATSVVLAVRDRSGTTGVLKLSPDTAFLDHQVGMLRHLGPTGRAPGILRQDAGAGAVLLERVEPGDTLDSLRATPPTPRDWADLLADLHGTPTAGVPDRLQDRCAEMFERIGARQQRVREHVPDTVWDAAVADCRDLLRTGREQVVIHGDLHLGNVLDGGDRGLVVIDPKLCVGDRCFDMVDFVVTGGDVPVMLARAEQLAALVHTDPDRLLRWCRVNAVVSAVSLLTWHGPTERSRTLLELAAYR